MCFSFFSSVPLVRIPKFVRVLNGVRSVFQRFGWILRRFVRPFLIQSDFSVENGLFRLKPKSSFLTQSKKGFFDSTFFDWVFRLADPVEKLSRKSFTRIFWTDRIVHPTTKHPHGHTTTHPYQVPHCSIIQGADAGVAITAVASRSKSAWRIPSSAHQQRVSHDGSSAPYRFHAANNGCACCSFGGSRLGATPRT